MTLPNIDELEYKTVSITRASKILGVSQSDIRPVLQTKIQAVRAIDGKGRKQIRINEKDLPELAKIVGATTFNPANIRVK